MLDVATQQKFSRNCSDAGLGYAQATSAAYSQVASQMMDFWLQAMTGIAAGLDASDKPKPVTAPKAPELPFGFSPMDWMPFAMFDKRRMDAALSVDPASNPFGAFMSLFYAVPLKGMPASWPFAQAMINAGVPRDVAWPTAEANAAMIGAAEAATQGFQKVLVACQTGSGFASSMPSAASGMKTFNALMNAAPWPRVLN